MIKINVDNDMPFTVSRFRSIYAYLENDYILMNGKWMCVCVCVCVKHKSVAKIVNCLAFSFLLLCRKRCAIHTITPFRWSRERKKGHTSMVPYLLSEYLYINIQSISEVYVFLSLRSHFIWPPLSRCCLRVWENNVD